MEKLAMQSWLGRIGLMRRRKDAATSGLSTTIADKFHIGILAFEIASLMSKLIRLWQSLADDQVARLRDDTLRQDGVRKLVSDDEDFLLGLAVAEMLDCFCFLARSTARLGKKCSDPHLRRFDHALSNLISTGEDQHGLEYAGKKMERKVKKMEKFISASVTLFQEMEVLSELELSLRRMQATAAATDQGDLNLLGFRQKVLTKRQEVRCLREASLWNRTYDYTVRLLARSLFTIVGRIRQVFAFHHTGGSGTGIGPDAMALQHLPRSQSSAGVPIHDSTLHSSHHAISFSGPLRAPGSRFGSEGISKSGPITRTMINNKQCRPQRWTPLRAARISNSKTKWSVPGGPFKGCIATGEDSQVLPSCISTDGDLRRYSTDAAATAISETQFVAGNISYKDLSMSLFAPQRKLLVAPASTLGAAALGLQYANVIVVVEKFSASPHLIGPDARDDLYSMLPTSIRSELRAKLKVYSKNLAASVYDPVLASEWSDALARILEWLAPLAHNMIRWQSERNYEQQHLVSKTNILLLQTLYFANQAKTEAVITELLVGLNYLWRFGRELHAKAMMESMSVGSFDVGDHLDLKG